MCKVNLGLDRVVIFIKEEDKHLLAFHTEIVIHISPLIL